MEYIVTDKYGRMVAVHHSIVKIAEWIGTPYHQALKRMHEGKPIMGKYLITPRDKHEYIWHKYGGIHGGDDRFAFCSKEELAEYKKREAEENDRNERLKAKQFLQRLLR